jgi:hypothetical protein
MRLALILALFPCAAQAGANPESLYKLIAGTWAATPAACATEATWTFAEGSVIVRDDGGETCGFDRPGTDGRIDVVLDVLCPIHGEEMQASARRIGLDLHSVSPGLRNPGDTMTITDQGQTLTLIRCD